MCERCEELRQEHREARWRWNREKVELLMGESPWCDRLWRMIEHLRDRLTRTQEACRKLAGEKAYIAREWELYISEMNMEMAETRAVFTAAMAAYRAQPHDAGDALGALWQACREAEGE